LNWYRRAAELGHVKAQGWLGHVYTQGRLVETDYGAAGKWAGLAAERGDPTAMMVLFAVHFGGPDGVKDPTEAMKWALLLSLQHGGDSDYDKAVRLFLAKRINIISEPDRQAGTARAEVWIADADPSLRAWYERLMESAGRR